MKNRQTDISSFFGGKPKAPTAGASGSRAAGSSAEAKPPAAAASEQPAAAEAGPGRLKRLRKAGEEAPGNPALAAAAANDLEDSDHDDGAAAPAALPSASPSPAPTSRKRTSKTAGLVADEVQVAAEALAAQKADEEMAAEEAAEEIDVSSGGEESGLEPEIASPSAKKPKKAAGGAAKGKADGVGNLAIEAAKKHGAFDLLKSATWAPGAPVPFSVLADTLRAIEAEPKRLAITVLAVNLFRAVIATTPEDLLPLVYLCVNKVAAAHKGLELGIGDATLIKALGQATGRKEDRIKADYEAGGDLGVVAAAARATQKTMFAPPPLTVRGVYKAFCDIAESSGAKSQERKKGMIVKLLVASKQTEAMFVMRALQGKLRIGLAEQTVLVALAHAVLLQREGVKGSSETVAAALEEGARILKRVYSECPSYDDIIPALLSAPLAELPDKVHFKPGVPIRAMLAKPVTAVSQVLDKFSEQPFTCEYKYDGERAQIHVLEDGSVKIYSRNSEDTTGKFPDVAALVPKALAPGVKSIVLDAEVVAWDKENNKILPFQILTTRARKDVSTANIKVAVSVFAFDCLYVDGRSLLQSPLTERREAMLASLIPQPGELEFASAKTSNDVEELTRFLDDAVEHGTEGLIVKTLGDNYEPSKRSSHWLKLKKDYIQGVGDTLDLVPIGAWHGKGKRTGVFGSFLLAVWDPDSEEYQTVTKIGTGFSEVILKELSDALKDTVVPQPKPYYRYGEGLIPDVWFEPKAVWEVKCADISISPAHKAGIGLVDPAKGISIRFPRLVRAREDKGPEDSTSPQQLAEMYRAQAVISKKGGGGKAAADDDYDY